MSLISEARVDEDQGCHQSCRLSKQDKMCSLISFHLLICSSFLLLVQEEKIQSIIQLQPQRLFKMRPSNIPHRFPFWTSNPKVHLNASPTVQMEGAAEGKGYQKRPRGENWFWVSALLQLRIPRHHFVNAEAERPPPRPRQTGEMFLQLKLLWLDDLSLSRSTFLRCRNN